MNKKLKKRIIDVGISQVSLAKEVGISPVNLSQYVNGWRNPSEEIKKGIAAKLYCQVDDIFNV